MLGALLLVAHLPQKHPSRFHKVSGVLLSAPAPVKTLTFDPATLTPVRLFDTNAVLAVPGIPLGKKKGDLIPFYRLDEPRARGDVPVEAVWDDSPLLLSPWPSVYVRGFVVGPLLKYLSLLGAAISLTGTFSLVFLLWLSRRPIELEPDPFTGPALLTQEMRVMERSLQHLLVGLVLLLMGVATFLTGTLLSGVKAPTLALTCVVLGVLALRKALLPLHRYLSPQICSFLLPPSPQQAAWILSRPEGRRALRYMRGALSPAELEVALVLAGDGATLSLRDLVSAARSV